MEIANQALGALCFVINICVACMAFISISKWHARMERKLDDIKKYIKHVTDRNDVVYINQLEDIKRRLIEQERYEEAIKINECIEKEYKKLRNNGSNKTSL